ncbi:MAG: hypothetical protein RMY34_22895 [Aulosira sp. DedQUE10]|nr:hypothetical protein [Aulosira sp. DedQUE10]
MLVPKCDRISILGRVVLRERSHLWILEFTAATSTQAIAFHHSR